MKRWMRWVALVLVFAAGGLSVYFGLRSDQCDGLPREIGACAGNRPTYAGATCDSVGSEWGAQLNERVEDALDGSVQRRGASDSVLLLDAEILTIQLANKHLRDTGLIADCDANDFLRVAESQFSDRARSEVGRIMYEGSPIVGYDDWLARLQGHVELIFSDRSSPYQPVS